MSRTNNNTQALVMSKAQLQTTLQKSLKKINVELVNLYGGYMNPETGKPEIRNFKLIAGNFKMNENDSNNINIHTTEDLSYLIKAYGHMTRIDKEYIDSAIELGLKEFPVCKWLTAEASLWIHDIRLRIFQIVNKDKIQKLESAKAKLTTFLSEDERLRATLQEIADLI